MPKKTVRLDVGIWFNEATGHIHFAASATGSRRRPPARTLPSARHV